MNIMAGCIVHVIEEDILVICPNITMFCGSAVLTCIGCICGPIGKILDLFYVFH